MSADNKKTDKIQEKLDFILFGKQEKKALQQATKALKKALPKSLDNFYKHLEDWPRFSEMFGNSQERMNAAKGAQIMHWLKIVEGSFQEEYISSVKAIGDRHNRLGLEPSWYIGGYTIIASGVVERLTDQYMSNPISSLINRRKYKRTISAFLKAMMLDMDLSISSYLDAMEDEKRKLINGISDNFDSSVGEIVTRLARSTQETSGNIETVAAAAEELSASIREISEQVQVTSTTAKTTSTLVQESKEQMQKLSENVSKITDFADMINDIAEQTNLLALNATIESARAGEAGKGFAVVANEVKTLASETSNVTKEIIIQIEAIQAETQNTVNKINSVVEQMNELEKRSVITSTAVEEQDSATNEISRSAQEASHRTSSLASEAEKLQGTVEIFLSKVKARNNSNLK